MLSSDQYTGLWPATHSDCGAIAKPSLLRFAAEAGRWYTVVARNFPWVAVAPVSMSSRAVLPLQVSSHSAHRWPVDGSNSRSITLGKPLAMVATRVKPPVVWSSA